MKTTEEIFFFKGSKGRSLLGFVYLPPQIKNTGIILCHSFADEHNLSIPVLVKASREIADLGFPVFRFDMSGCGDSEGNLEDITVNDWLEDLSAAIDCFKNKFGINRYALWGLRFGAGLGLLHNNKFPNASFLILWQPVIDFLNYFRQFLLRIIAQNITSKSGYHSTKDILTLMEKNGYVTVFGYPVTKDFYDSLCKIKSEILLNGIQASTLIQSISMIEKPSARTVSFIDNIKKSGQSVCHRHIIAEPFWDRYWRFECDEATKTMIEWLNDNSKY